MCRRYPFIYFKVVRWYTQSFSNWIIACMLLKRETMIYCLQQWNTIEFQWNINRCDYLRSSSLSILYLQQFINFKSALGHFKKQLALETKYILNTTIVHHSKYEKWLARLSWVHLFENPCQGFFPMIVHYKSRCLLYCNIYAVVSHKFLH